MRWICAAAVLVAGCSQVLGIDELGGPGGTGSDAGPRDAAADAPDGPPIGPMIKISGTVADLGSQPPAPIANAALKLITSANAAELAHTSSDGTGAFTLMVPTDGGAIDAFVTADVPGFVASRMFTQRPLTADALNVRVGMLSPNRLQLLAQQCGPGLPANEHTIFAFVVDANSMPLSGADVRTTPSALFVCYTGPTGTPQPGNVTGPDGVGYAFGVPTGQPTRVESPLTGYAPRMLPPVTQPTISFVPLGP